ncbi:hypothetical protein KL911_002667, partial [Ogataea haglerorum]
NSEDRQLLDLQTHSGNPNDVAHKKPGIRECLKDLVHDVMKREPNHI